MGLGRTRIDLTGRAFGYLKVVRFHHKDEDSGVAVWECVCTRCGTTGVLAKSYNLRYGRVKSCGCYRKAALAERCTRHGKYNTRLYRLWARLKYSAKKTHVEFDEKWEDYADFEQYVGELGYNNDNMPKIKRIETSGGWVRGNCRFISRHE